ncbi:uncharacterized protein LOC144281109 [Canis aureus]
MRLTYPSPDGGFLLYHLYAMSGETEALRDCVTCSNHLPALRQPKIRTMPSGPDSCPRQAPRSGAHVLFLRPTRQQFPAWLRVVGRGLYRVGWGGAGEPELAWGQQPLRYAKLTYQDEQRAGPDWPAATGNQCMCDFHLEPTTGKCMNPSPSGPISSIWLQSRTQFGKPEGMIELSGEGRSRQQVY